ncbi:nucleoside hydrolase, partial [Natronoarchaeum mannanilyticum]
VAAHIAGDVLTFEPRALSVVDGRGPCRGATIADTRADSNAEPTASVATEIDVEAYRETVVDALLSLA